MNIPHLKAFLWLRWRLLVNQWRRGGRLNAALMIIIVFGAAATAIPLFAGCLWLGLQAIPKAEPILLLAAWDILIVAFLFFWSIGLLSELQRSEPLALSKFLHLPVSAGEAFLINYVSSLVSLSLVVFAPMMLAYAIALVITKGPAMIPSMVGLAAFLLMITALTYQFRGWLATIMSNPRRRRTVIVVATGLFILVVQIPNLLNMYAPWAGDRAQQSAQFRDEIEELSRELDARRIDGREFERKRHDLREQRRAELERQYRGRMDRWSQTARLVNMVLPVGWLPLGVMSAAEGNVLPSLLGLAGMTLIGAGSLRWAYRSTIKLYQGEPTNAPGRPRREKSRKASSLAPSSANLLLEARIPRLSEPVSVIALGALQSLVRSPEAKMMLLSSGIMLLVFGSMALRGGTQVPEWTRPLSGIGAMALVLFSLSSVMANQFGFDRDGFRVFVLSSVRRRDILLGKNLAFAPIIVGIAALLLGLLQVVRPMRLDHLLAMPPQLISMYLLYCILTNLLSIYAPVYVPAGSLRPSNPTASTVFLQLATLMVLLPMLESLTLIPIGTELLLDLIGKRSNLPICLVLTFLQFAIVVPLYLLSLRWQGRLLQEREQRILERVTAKSV